jgi:hypothetical protein
VDSKEAQRFERSIDSGVSFKYTALVMWMRVTKDLARLAPSHLGRPYTRALSRRTEN